MASLIPPYLPLIVAAAECVIVAMLIQVIPVYQASTQYDGWPSTKMVVVAILTGLLNGMQAYQKLMKKAPEKN